MPRARKKARTSTAEDERFQPPDRPDQIQLDAGDVTETVDILGKDDRGGDRVEDEPGDRRDTDADDARAPDVESREQRTRQDDDGEDDPPLRSEGADPDERRTRVERRGRDERGDGDEGERDYSRRVQRRINREIALRKRTEAQLADERTARQKLEQRITKIERSQVDEQGEASLREIDAKIKLLAADLIKAKEDNNTAREVELQIALDEAKTEKTRLQVRLEMEQQERTRAAAAATTTTSDPDDSQRQPQGKGRSAEWIRANRRWWNTARWAEARTDAISHDETILAEIEDGELDFEPYSDEHMDELARRLKTDYPDLEVRTVDGEVFADEHEEEDIDNDEERGDRMNGKGNDRQRRGTGNARNARAPMGGLGGRDGRRERNEVELARRGKITLTEEDKQTMRVFKLDPNDPQHKKYFARERARTILGNANKGART